MGREREISDEHVAEVCNNKEITNCPPKAKKKPETALEHDLRTSLKGNS